MSLGGRRLILLMAGLFALAMPQIAWAGSSADASRVQNVVGTNTAAPDLATVNADWPFEIGATLAGGSSVDYRISVRGPKKDGGPSETSSIAVFIRHSQLSGVDRFGIFSYCQRCTSDKMGFHGEFSGDSFVQMNLDSVNHRWAIYIDNTFVRMITSSAASLDEANFLKIGAETIDSDNEMGPFVHQKVWIRRASTGLQSPFAPTNSSAFLAHPPPTNRFFTYFHGDGHLMVFTNP